MGRARGKGEGRGDRRREDKKGGGRSMEGIGSKERGGWGREGSGCIYIAKESTLGVYFVASTGLR